MLSVRANANFDPRSLRRTVLDMAYAGKACHIACAFSLIEIMAVLYRTHLRYPDNNPRHESRDYLVLSKGHGVMAQYACMYEKGWISHQQISSYFSDGTELKGLSDSRVAGLEVTSGSLGHGICVGVGMAIAAKRMATDQKVYVIIGDGEANEGPVWEALMLATHHKLDNFLVIVDQNGFQAMGATDEVLGLGDLQVKFEAFGFECVRADGHDEGAIDGAIRRAWGSSAEVPKAVVARTIKGKGVSFMEGDNRWHYMRLNEDTYSLAIQELQG